LFHDQGSLKNDDLNRAAVPQMKTISRLIAFPAEDGATINEDLEIYRGEPRTLFLFPSSGISALCKVIWSRYPT
jgi:hypothetical protein